jgi:hypothetical protein
MAVPESMRGAEQADRAERPIFIIGTERSGSNLLRLVLNAHSQIAVPHPPHLMRYLAPLAGSYGDLTIERNRRVLVHDALRLLRHHIHPWPHPIDADLVTSQASPTVFGVVAAVYEQFRRAEGKRTWGCKSTFMVHYVANVVAEYPQARFLWLVRDPRDVAVSSMRSVFNPCHPLRTARLWRRQQEIGWAARERWGPARIRLMRYEDLVVDPRRELTAACEFLGVAFEESLLRHHDSPAARQTAALSDSWRNTARPISSTSVGRHERVLTAADRRLVEAVAGPVMARLGYLVPDGEAPPALPSELRVLCRELLIRFAVEFRAMRTDRNYVRRLARDTTVRALRVKAWLRRPSTPWRRRPATPWMEPSTLGRTEDVR